MEDTFEEKIPDIINLDELILNQSSVISSKHDYDSMFKDGYDSMFKDGHDSMFKDGNDIDKSIPEIDLPKIDESYLSSSLEVNNSKTVVSEEKTNIDVAKPVIESNLVDNQTVNLQSTNGVTLQNVGSVNNSEELPQIDFNNVNEDITDVDWESIFNEAYGIEPTLTR